VVFRSFQTRSHAATNAWIPKPAREPTGPPGETHEHESRRNPGKEADQAGADEFDIEVHRRSGHRSVELTRRGEIIGQCWILQMADAGRPNAVTNQRLVEPRGHLVAQIHADCGLNRSHDQHEDECEAGQCQR
jgi:hypothetical protein